MRTTRDTSLCARATLVLALYSSFHFLRPRGGRARAISEAAVSRGRPQSLSRALSLLLGKSNCNARARAATLAVVAPLEIYVAGIEKEFCRREEGRGAFALCGNPF